MSEVLTEILRVDPTFDKDRFLRQCESDIIPNILEVRAMLQPCGGPGPLDTSPHWGGTKLLRLFSEQILAPGPLS